MEMRLRRVVVALSGISAGVLRPLVRCISSAGGSSTSRITSHPGAPSGALGQMRQADVITRVGPSERLPGLRGVFLTRPVKKFHPIEVLPAAATHVTAASSTPSTTAVPHAAAASASSATAHTLAPPLVVNLAFAPRHHISLRRFLAQRHMFSTSAYLMAATEHGWYLIAPSSAAPHCPDVAGLEAWCTRHHHRYLARPPRKGHARAETAEGVGAGAAVLGEGAASSALAESSSIAQLEAALDSGEELTEAQLQLLAAEETAARQHEPHREEDDDQADYGDDDDLEERPVRAEGGFGRDAASASPSAQPAGDTQPSYQLLLKVTPPLITEAHLFEINDGVEWPLPPSDDLANQAYWRNHPQRMAVYESTGDADMADQRDALLAALRSDPAVMQRRFSEQELYAAAEALHDALKQKANIMLNVDAATGLLHLVPLRDLQAGEELLLHYGREWWTGRLLSSLLLAVSDAQVQHIRWIERLFGHATDNNVLFPMLVPAHAQRRRRRRGRRAVRAETATQISDVSKPPSSSSPSPPSYTDASASSGSHHGRRLVLYDTVSRKRATNAAVLAFTVRRSCVDQAFLNRLVMGDAAAGLPPVFELSTPDAEVPIRVLRRVLLGALTGHEKPARASDASNARVGAAAGHPSQRQAHNEAAGVLCDVPDEDDDTVFSV